MRLVFQEPMTEIPAQMIGQTVAHYRILEKIGSGGMGDVYLAEDTTLDRKVALKVLPPELADDTERRARFTREAKAVAALNHPNIVTLHSVEEAGGRSLHHDGARAGEDTGRDAAKKGLRARQVLRHRDSTGGRGRSSAPARDHTPGSQTSQRHDQPRTGASRCSTLASPQRHLNS